MTVQTSELMANNPEMIKSMIDLILTYTVSSLVEDDEDDYHSYLRELLIKPGTDIVNNYKEVTASILLFEEYRQLLPLVTDVIDNIGCELFSEMWEKDSSCALSEVLRCFGHGVSFWDNYNWSEFGLDERPKVGLLEEPWDIGSRVLAKIDANFNTEEDENREFSLWLAENYEEAGNNASDGEMWYLSLSPHEFMPCSLSVLRDKYNAENCNLNPRCYQSLANAAEVI